MYSYITNKERKIVYVYLLENKNLIEIYINIIESAKDNIWHDEQTEEFIEKQYEERTIIRN